MVGMDTLSIECQKMCSGRGSERVEKKVRTSLLRRMSMVVLGVILFASSAVWPSGADRATAAENPSEWNNVYQSLSHETQFKDVAYHDGVWIAISRQSPVMRSTDGVTWNSVPMSEFGLAESDYPDFSNVIFADGKWVIGRYFGGIYTSVDSENWTTTRNASQGDRIRSIVYGDNKFIILSYRMVNQIMENYFLVSEDGINWNEEPGTKNISNSGSADMAFGDGKYALTTVTGGFYTSINGLDWKLNSSISQLRPYAVTYDGTKFWIAATIPNINGASEAMLYSSTDAESWSPLSIGNVSGASSVTLFGIDYSNGRYTAVGSATVAGKYEALIYSSINGIDWVRDTVNLMSYNEYNSFQAAASSPQQSVAVGIPGMIYNRGLSVPANNNLENLEISPDKIEEPFDSNYTNYHATVTADVYRINVIPTAVDSEAEIRISVNDGPLIKTNSTELFEVLLNEGQNYITIQVGSSTNSASTPKVYNLNVFREFSTYLKDLSVDPGTLNPVFDAFKKDYKVEVGNEVSEIKVKPIADSKTAEIKVNGIPTVSGEVYTAKLQEGLNEIIIEVTNNGPLLKSSVSIEERASASPVPQNYTIRVTRKSAIVTPGPSDPGTTTPVTPTPTPPVPTTPAPTTPTPTIPTPTAPANGLEVLVNGQPTTVVATGGPAQVNGQTVFTATIDTARLTSYLAGTTGSPIVTIPVRTEADRVIATMTGEAAALLNSRNATLRIESPLGNYTIPSSQIRLGTAASTLGLTEGSANLNVNVMIEKSGSDVENRLSQAAASGGFTAASEPIDFMITVSSGDRTVEVDSFTEYVEREIPLPASTNSNQITTAVVIEDNGTVRHVPTAVTRTGNDDYARINSLTNSSYALIWNPKQFSDVAGKWSQDSVNDMASRMIVNGIGNDRYNPEGAVTRAEFAAILVRAMGLPTSGQTNGFSDVSASDWYAGAASTANAYGLITGYPNGTFAPNATITRQEAFAILDRATQIVPLQPSDSGSELNSYRDRADVASWARTSTQAILASGLAEGSGGWLRPEATLSRAESAAVAQRLLQQGGLID